jgi:hypothetical protein
MSIPGDAAQPDRDLALAEVGSLRAELNSVIDRINSNENVCGGAVGGLALLHGASFLPAWSIVVLALGITAMGWRRFHELRVHMDRLDNYLCRLELSLSPGSGGWSANYRQIIAGRWTRGTSATRMAFWIALLVVAALPPFLSDGKANVDTPAIAVPTMGAEP